MGFPLELVSALGAKNYNGWATANREKSLTIAYLVSSGVWIQYTNVTEGQTLPDRGTCRQRPTATAFTHSFKCRIL